MAHEIIADDKGAIIYSNTDGTPYSKRITHPHKTTESAHRKLANKVIEHAETRPDELYPTRKEYERVIETLRNDLLND